MLLKEILEEISKYELVADTSDSTHSTFHIRKKHIYKNEDGE